MESGELCCRVGDRFLTQQPQEEHQEDAAADTAPSNERLSASGEDTTKGDFLLETGLTLQV
jgi:hypothetical protein